MLYCRGELELAEVGSSDDRQEVVEHFLQHTEGPTRADQEAQWSGGRGSFSRYGRIILSGVQRLPEYYRSRSEYIAYTAAIKELFDNEQAFLYTLRDSRAIVGIGSIILGQEIHDGLGQCGNRANLDYYLRPDASDQLHCASADMLYEALEEHNENNEGCNGRQKAGFAAVPNSSNPSIGFRESVHFSTTDETLCLEPAGKTFTTGDLFDITHAGALVKLYEIKNKNTSTR